MPAGQIASFRTTVQLLFLLLVCGGAACSRKSNPGQATGAPSASASSGGPSGTARPGLACTTPGTSFSLGPVERPNENGDEGEVVGGDGRTDAPSEPAIDLPFGVTVGGIRAHDGGFVISAVDARQGGSHAVLAFLDLELARGSVLDLGRVYGDAEPPRFALRADGVFVVVPDMDAGGSSFRYGWVRGFDARSPLQWLGSFEQQVDDSPVFSLADTSQAITVAWDEIDRKSRRGVVRWAAFDPKGQKVSEAASAGTGKDSSKRKPNQDWAIRSTGPDVDAEAPQLVAHGAGYWLAYLASEAKPAKGSSGAGDGRAKNGDEDVRAIDLGRRGIEIVPLDAMGQVNGKPIRIVERSARVVTFDIEATTDGGAIVAYRDVDTTPGAEAQVIEIARLRTDGGVDRLRLDDDRVGAGMPVLLVDPAPSSNNIARHLAWVAVASPAGETRLAPVPAGGSAMPELVEASELVGVEPMLWRGDSMVVARHRARFVEFERVNCAWLSNQPVGASH